MFITDNLFYFDENQLCPANMCAVYNNADKITTFFSQLLF